MTEEQKCTCEKVPELNYISSNPDCPVHYPKIDWEQKWEEEFEEVWKERGDTILELKYPWVKSLVLRYWIEAKEGRMAICPYCGKLMNREDYEMTGGHRECLQKAEEEEEKMKRPKRRDKIFNMPQDYESILLIAGEQKWEEEFNKWWNEDFRFISPGYKEVMLKCWLESRRRFVG